MFLSISIIGQVLDHPLNFQGANISIPIGITFGNQTIWVSTYNVIVGSGIKYENSVKNLI